MKFKIAKLSPDDITVRLGAHNLTYRSEEDAVDRSVTDIYVHPDWKCNDERYDADVAILVLNESVTFSDHIRPVCMPPSNYLLDGLTGTVVGWGRTENGTAEGIPRKIEVNALSNTHCYNTDEGIASYASERSFCGEGSGTPNKGDSGGGFFAVAGSGWVQFGTVSFVRPKATGNTLKIGLYMKLSSFRDWIGDRVEQSGGAIGGATIKSDLNCTYRHIGEIYGCFLNDLNIRQENFAVEKFTGSHDINSHDEDVELISFESGVIAALPFNFGNIFKRLKFLLTPVNIKRFSRSNFQNLEKILIVRGKVEELDEDSLWDLPNLQLFQLDESDLKLLHPATFSRNYKLTGMQVVSNALKSLPGELFRNNLLLEYVAFYNNSIEIVDEDIFQTNVKLKSISFRKNRLRHLSGKLLEANLELESIHLSNNLIQTLDEQLFVANVNIQRIYLMSNLLTLIPANIFRNNFRLNVIELSGNSIEAIDESLFENNFLLQKVYLDYNRLAGLPPHLFRQNVMLKIASFRDNMLEAIDELFFEWNSMLEQISFQNNFLTVLPGKLFQNNSLLQKVYFNENSLETLDELTFQANADLREVHLSSNLLTFLPDRLFFNNPLLQIVDLSQNFIRTLNENIFSRNVNLVKIYLQRNLLQSLPSNLFPSERLTYIDLRGNSLYNIKTNFTTLKRANYINLSRNVCVDTVFYSNGEGDFSNLTEFQDFIITKCS